MNLTAVHAEAVQRAMADGPHRKQHFGGVHVGAHAQLLGGLLADEELVAGDHLDLDALLNALLDGLLGVVSRRVEQRQQHHKVPLGVRGCTSQWEAVRISHQCHLRRTPARCRRRLPEALAA